MTLMRFCYGALTVMLLMLCRYALVVDSDDGLRLLGLAVGVSGVGFFVAAVVTPWAAGRLGPGRWIAVCAAGAASWNRPSASRSPPPRCWRRPSSWA
jgi:hypothetical protein